MPEIVVPEWMAARLTEKFGSLHEAERYYGLKFVIPEDPDNPRKLGCSDPSEL